MSEPAEKVEEQAKQVIPWQAAIGAAKEKFLQIASKENMVVYEKESMFALQAIVKNDRVLKAAYENPTSVRNAVINVAAVGLSLNPATKLAYLIPRDNEVCLDISYMGLIKIATDTGSIMWAQADIVYEHDSFEYRGPSEKPIHSADVFNPDRGNKVGVYCIAKTVEGDYLIETMSAIEMLDIRKKSIGSDSKYSPWVNFEGEMWKKAVIKRASKTWPKTERTPRLDEAIQVLNEHDGLQEEYLNHRQTIDVEPVDLMKIEDLAHRCREIIDMDEEEEYQIPTLLAEINDSLTNDERSAIASKLLLSKPEGQRKTYGSIYNQNLREYKQKLKDDADPELQNANHIPIE